MKLREIQKRTSQVNFLGNPRMKPSQWQNQPQERMKSKCHSDSMSAQNPQLGKFHDLVESTIMRWDSDFYPYHARIHDLDVHKIKISEGGKMQCFPSRMINQLRWGAWWRWFNTWNDYEKQYNTKSTLQQWYLPLGENSELKKWEWVYPPPQGIHAQAESTTWGPWKWWSEGGIEWSHP